jgi:multiple sugar transport system ATP-binding protein
MTMATRIVVMKAGYIQQIGSPFEIYNNPSNLFVAGFIGSPAMNFIEATYEKGVITFFDGKKIKLDSEVVKAHDDFYQKALAEVNLELEKFEQREAVTEQEIKERGAKLTALKETAASFKEPHKLVFGIRPEDVFEATAENREKHPGDVYKIKVEVAELLGHEYYVHTDFAGCDLVAKIPSVRPISIMMS